MILESIVQNKILELAVRKKQVPMETLRRMISGLPPPRNFKTALSGSGIKLIAEVKKASPTRGIICENFNPLSIARAYTENGAAAISVLTETRYFQGNLNYLSQIDAVLGRGGPALLRKDFIVEPYQLYESRAFGADAVLLIMAVLGYNQLTELLGLSHQLGMHCLVEIHNEDEAAKAVASGAPIIGINNRDLLTFKVNLDITERLRSLLPLDRIVVSESGIKTRDDMRQLQKWGVNAALVGESLMSSGDIPTKMKELLS